MKRIIVIAIFVIVSLNVMKAQQGVCFGIKAGLNLENIIGLNSGTGVVGVSENESSKMTFGVHAGGLARIGFDDHWALVPEVLYTTGGAKRTVAQTYTILGTTNTSHTEGTFSLSYIQVPIFVNYQFDNGIFLEAGPYLAFLVGKTVSSTTTDENGNTTTSLGSQDQKVNGFDWGVGAGIGYRFCGGLGFNLRYNYGLNHVYKDYSVDNSGLSFSIPSYGNNGVLQFSVSYLFGCSTCDKTPKSVAAVEPIPASAPPPQPAPVPEKQVEFTVNAPSSVPGQHTVIENIPLRDYVFFDAGSNAIPPRYMQLSSDQAASFKEEQLQNCQKDPGTQASRAMTVYHNVLNIVGDRMRKYPNSTIKLVGSSAGNGVEAGKANATAVKDYLVNNFGINPSRITVEGRNQPMIQSEQPYSTQFLNLTKDEDNRVDIASTSTDLMMEVKGNSALCLKPIDVTTTDGSLQDDAPVIVNVGSASELLDSWSVDIKDPKGITQHFGPYTSDKESLSGRAILDGNPGGTYTMVLNGTTKSGHNVTKETTFLLTRKDEPNATEQRYIILFEFDKSTTVATYQNFLTNLVVPVIPNSSKVIIYGHTDIVGDTDYNYNLSFDRSNAAKAILKDETLKASKFVTYETIPLGEGSPVFGNILPEERFYNRNVIIDIIPNDLISIGAR